jgi:hypothetical protein
LQLSGLLPGVRLLLLMLLLLLLLLLDCPANSR